MKYEEIKQGYQFGYQKIKEIEDINYVDSTHSDIVWLSSDWSQMEVEEKVNELIKEYYQYNTYPKIYYKIWMRLIGLTFIKDIEKEK
jgi:hypothetical protein